MTNNEKPHCTNSTPSWFVGHWKDWHRGHGCSQDDGKPRTEDARIEIAQHEARATTGYLTDAELRFLRASTTSGNELLVRGLDELAARRTAEKTECRLRHAMMGPPGWRCACGTSFNDYYGLAEHVRLSIHCPRCGADAAATIADREIDRWICGHWIARGDFSATLRDDNELLDHYPTYGPNPSHVACVCGHVEAVNGDINAAIDRVIVHANSYKAGAK